jgi:hypothetical protein
MIQAIQIKYLGISPTKLQAAVAANPNATK